MTHVMIWRGNLPEDSFAGFWHHGILSVDGDSVIHYAGMDGVKTLSNAKVMRTPMSDFVQDGTRPVHTVEYDPRTHTQIYTPDEIEERAAQRIGHAQYDLVRDNCESFARWCVTGIEISQQSTGAIVGVAAGAASLLFGGGLLGAVFTAVVTHKCWDRRTNRSSIRQPPPEDTDDD